MRNETINILSPFPQSFSVLYFPRLYFLSPSAVSLGSLLGFLPLSLLVSLILSFYPLFPEAPEKYLLFSLFPRHFPPFSHLPLPLCER